MFDASQQKAEKRAQIIRTSLQLFANHGYDSTTIRMISKEAGISLGLLYNYFKGKNEVLKVIYDQHISDVQGSFKVDADGSDPATKFAHLLDSIFESVNRNMLFYKLLYSLRMQPSVQKLLAPQFISLNNFIHLNMEHILKELGYRDYMQESKILFALIDGMSNHYVLYHRQYPIDELKAAIVKRYCRHKLVA